MQTPLPGNLKPAPKHHRGFTLVELMIAMVLAMVVLGAALAVCAVYKRQFRRQQMAIAVQQSLTGAMTVMEQQIRMVGYDPQESNRFGIVDVRRYDLMDAGRVNAQGQPSLFYTLDRNADGALEGGSGARNGEHPNFRIQQKSDSNSVYLSYDNGSGRRPLAGYIKAMGLAYAVDVDGDGQLDAWNDGPHLIWAVDSDNDNLLDTHIDTDDDGVITFRDDQDGNGRIDGNDGGRLSIPVALKHIRVVRVWLMAVSDFPVKGHWDSATYAVGDRILYHPGDGRIRRLMETTIQCRNLSSL